MEAEQTLFLAVDVPLLSYGLDRFGHVAAIREGKPSPPMLVENKKTR
jgi:hypothetical protein